MDVVLKVLEGAKHGAKVAVKKSEFTIGRSQECSLCAGSTAVSRKHCLITRDENHVAVKDLGSRNGTLVNGEKIEGTVQLQSGDELTVGPLKFLVTISTGIANAKKPQVKSVAEAVDRAANGSSSSVGMEDISQWLLGPDLDDASAVAETQTIMMDDTNAGKVATPPTEEPQESPGEIVADNEHDKQDEHDGLDEQAEGDEDAETAETNGGKKKGPGKLPKLSAKPATKDSREAAAEALRNWNRRR